MYFEVYLFFCLKSVNNTYQRTVTKFGIEKRIEKNSFVEKLV